MSRLLQPIEQHDRQQRADMQRGRGAIEADIAGDGRGTRQPIERLGFRNLMNESSRGEHVEEVGFVGIHRDPAYYDAAQTAQRRGWCNRSHGLCKSPPGYSKGVTECDVRTTGV